jgi:hypothetical protein
MAWIDDSWLQKAYESLKATVGEDRHLKKDMVQFLLDEGFWDKDRLQWDSAIARFNDCINPTKEQFFKVGELWALMRRFGRHQLFLAMADDLGYEVRLRPTEERRQQLLERIADSTERFERDLAGVRADLQRVSGEEPAARPSPLGDRRVQFSKDDTRPDVP